MRAAAPVLVLALLALSGCAGSDVTMPPAFSDAEAAALTTTRYEYDRNLVLDQYPDAVIPDATIVSMAPNRDVWSQLQVNCLTQAGIRGASSTLGGYEVQGDNDPQDEDVARFVCRYQYPIDPRVLGALSVQQAGYAFDYLVERVVPCMHSLGFHPSPAPDRDAFITYSRSVWGSVLWSPYGRFQDPFFGDERTFVDSRCPPLPDDPFAVFNGTLTARIRGDG